MTAASASLAAPHCPPAPSTLADVIAVIQADPDLGTQRRHDVCSALRSVSKALQRRPEEIPAHPGHLRDRLRTLTPAMVGLSSSRWRNVLSLTRFALKRAGLTRMPARHCQSIAPAWDDILRPLNDRRPRIGLSRLAHYASQRGVDPKDVDDAFMGSFRDSLLHDCLVNDPLGIYRRTCVLWNHAAATNPAWPNVTLSVPQHRVAYTKPWSIFPASLQTELRNYLDHLVGRDILAERDFKPLRPTSVKSREFQLRQFVSAVVHRGHRPKDLRSFADLVAIQTVKDGLRFFLDRAQGNSTRQTHQIACTLKAIARHWVKVDAAHLNELRGLCRRLDPGQIGLTERNRARLRQFDSPANVRALVMLPQHLADAASRGSPTRARALAVQTALAIELLLMVPMRIGNLAGLDLDRHIVRGQGRGRGHVHLVIEGAEVKNGVDIEAELPPPTVALLDLYIARFRPLLLDRQSTSLFPGRAGRPKSIQSLRGQIVKCIAEKCGLRVNPHLFRHIAAKIYLDQNPGAYGLMRLVEGHKSVETTTKFYSGMEAPAAMRRFDEQILKLRHAPVPPAPTTPRPRPVRGKR
jgi:integrase